MLMIDFIAASSSLAKDTVADLQFHAALWAI
jgi:hypothetical protein